MVKGNETAGQTAEQLDNPGVAGDIIQQPNWNITPADQREQMRAVARQYSPETVPATEASETKVAQGHNPEDRVDLWKQYKDEKEFLAKSPAELRSGYNLPPNAPSERVFRGVAKELLDIYNNSSPEARPAIREALGLGPNDAFPKTVEGALNLFATRERRELGLGPNASYQEMETARAKKTWADRYVEIDKN
ncbi:MAG: hypothetical protein IAF58_20405 [Leptolyngbya sp.]|nr:hypothetical protein [Candidatus Melainabacteria bacterium]